MTWSRSRATVTAALAAAIVVAAPAAAFVCHPDAPGVRSLSVSGPVLGYALDGARVQIAHGGGGACYRTLWRPLARPAVQPSRSSVDCASLQSFALAGLGVEIASTAGRAPSARYRGLRATVREPRFVDLVRDGRLVRRLVRPSAEPVAKLVVSARRVVAVSLGDEARDVPPRLEVYGLRRGQLLRSIPLVDRPRTLAVHGDVAVFAAAGGHGTFAVRISDGRTTFVGPTRAFDTPQLDSAGLVLQSNLYKRDASSGRVVMKFVPTEVLHRGFDATFGELTLRWPVRRLAMDGPRVALAMDAPRGTCDEVRYWNIPWHYVIRVSMRTDMTCRRAMDIRNVTLGGITTAWLGEWGRERLVIASDSTSCIERLMAESSTRDVLLAGDRRLLAFAVPTVDRRGATVGLARTRTDGRSSRPVLVRTTSPVKALAVDADRIAVHRDDGRIEIRDARGRLLRTVDAPQTRAIALRGSGLFLLGRSGRLESRDVETGMVRRTWTLVDRPVSLDVHYGVAVTASRAGVRAIDLATNRSTIVAKHAVPSLVAIEASGIVYGSNAGGRGTLRTLSLHDVERLLKRP
jgi:hypothetical protein